jgi:hypothetical protein
LHERRHLLTTHQAKKLIADALAGPGRTYLYLGYARKVHYFRHQVANATEPSHNLLALRIEDEAQAFSARRGTSYFQQLAQIVVAPGFSRWQPEVGREQFTSKQSAKRAFARLLSAALGEVGFHSSYLSLRDDRQLRELFRVPTEGPRTTGGDRLAGQRTTQGTRHARALPATSSPGRA